MSRSTNARPTRWQPKADNGWSRDMTFLWCQALSEHFEGDDWGEFGACSKKLANLLQVNWLGTMHTVTTTTDTGTAYLLNEYSASNILLKVQIQRRRKAKIAVQPPLPFRVVTKPYKHFLRADDCLRVFHSVSCMGFRHLAGPFGWSAPIDGRTDYGWLPLGIPGKKIITGW